MRRCSVVIVTHNSQAVLGRCLESLREQTVRDWEAIVVDNASTDGTCALVRRTAPTARLIPNATNRGFGAAVNQALGQIGGAAVLTLNPDVVLDPGCLARLLDAAECAEESLGMLSPKLLRMDGRTIDSTGLEVSRAWRVRDRGAGLPDGGQFDDDRAILGPCAAAGLYRRTMLEALREEGQVFDERFFLLMEDVDLAIRAQRAGWQARYVPEALAYHRGGFSRRRSPQAQALSFRNRYYLIAKHHRWAWRDAGWLVAYDLPRLAWLALTNPAALLTLRDLLEHVPRLAQLRIQSV